MEEEGKEKGRKNSLRERRRESLESNMHGREEIADWREGRERHWRENQDNDGGKIISEGREYRRRRDP